MAGLQRLSLPLSPTKSSRRSPADSPERPKRKDPSGGTTGRVKLYGRLGWMGARAEYSRWGGITAPTFISRSTLGERSNRRAIFLTFLTGPIAKNQRAVARLASFAAELSDDNAGAESFS